MTRSRPRASPRLTSEPDRQRFAALRQVTLARTPGFLPGPAAPRQLAALWARAEQLGLTHWHRPDAQVLWFRDPHTWFGGPATIVMVDRLPGADDGLAVVLDVMRAHAEAFDETAWLEIDAHDRGLLAGLEALGFAIDSVIQVGDPAVARARLVARYDPPTTLDHLGLELAPAEPADVPGIITLHQRIFSARPELCFFGARPEHLAHMRQGLERQLAAREPGDVAVHHVVRERGVVVGHADADITHEHPFWGTYAGVGFILAEHLQGRGIVKSLYRVALDAALAHGARLMKGGTAQPAVLGLGRLMQRPWHAIGLRVGAPLPREHFLRFHPGA